MKIGYLFLSKHQLIILAVFLSLIIGRITSAQIKTESIPSFTKENIEPFLDSLITSLMKEQNIIGCGISIVNDSSIAFSKGYGYSDLENKKLVDPQRTLFRTASVCKIVVATTMIMLKEKGLIDFNTDINKYLKKFKVEHKFGEPITVAHLLTHTAGFDDFYIGKSARNETESIPLGEFLQKHIPEQITPSGEVYSYSNMGMALAALLVEDITGKDFEEYVIENLFLPLGMENSSFRIKEKFKDEIYKGYVYINGKQIEFPFDFLNDYPAGQMLTTVNEFSNFMIMQLQKGRFNEKQIVNNALMEEMQSVQFTHHPKLHTASGYGFMIEEYSGTKLLSHGGGYPGILTLLRLFPELHLGVFIAINGYNSNLNEIVSNEIMNKFFPYSKPESKIKYPITNLPEYDKNVDRFVGDYRFTRYSRNEITKIGLLLGLVGNELPIRKNDKDMLLMNDFSGRERRLIQIEPLFFQSIDDDYYIKFREDASGNITHLFTDGITALEKTSLLYTIKTQRIIFLAVTLIFTLAALSGLYLSIKSKLKKSAITKSKLFILTEKISNIYLIYLLVFGLIMNVITNPLEQLIGFPYGMPWYFYLLQVLPFIFIVLTLWFTFKFIVEIKRGSITKIAIPLYAVFLFVCITSVWFMNTWNLIGFKF